MRAGFVAIVGLPNAGKSTLMNRLLGQKITIASPKPQTTRNRILGVKNTADAQLVLVDTPGLLQPSRSGSQLAKYMLDQAMSAVSDVDVLLVVIEAPTGPLAKKLAQGVGYRVPRETNHLLQAVAEAKKPSVLAVNKVDIVTPRSAMLPVLDAWAKRYDWASVVPISADKGTGTDDLIAEITKVLPEGDRLFPEEMLTDRAERWIASEMVREQVFLLTKQEVPYATAVTIDTYDERVAKPDHPANVMIEATIHVEKEQQKGILVGEGGRMIREIGTRARHEIGQLLDCPVHLKLFVRVDQDWTQRDALIRDMGYE